MKKTKARRAAKPWANHKSLALMVHPKDIKKYEKDAHEKGVPVKFDKEGHPQFRSASEQRKYCQAYEYVNHDANWSAKEKRQ